MASQRLHALAQALEMELPRQAHMYFARNKPYYTQRMPEDHFAAAVCLKFTCLPTHLLLNAHGRVGDTPLTEEGLAKCMLRIG